MSLPRELLDDMLSRYMDNQLSDDERERVERILDQDPAARRSLEQLHEQRSLIRQALDTTPRLKSDFASRVLNAAIDEAERAGLDAKHPLVLAGKRDGTGARGLSRVDRRVLVGLLAMAASIALFAFVLTRGDRDQEGLAKQDNTEVAPEVSGDTLLADNTQAIREHAADLAVSAGSDSATTDNALAVDNSAAPMTLNANAAGDATVNRLGGDDSPDVTIPVEAIANDRDRTSPPPASTPNEMAPLDVAQNGLAKLNAVFVYEVRLTAEGAKNNVVGRLFREVGILKTDQRPVDEALVGFLQAGKLVSSAAANDTQAIDGASVVFLEGSAVKLDELMLKFLETQSEVSRVGFNMVMDPPILTAVSNLSQAVDPHQVRADNNANQSVVASRLVPDAVSSDQELSFVAGDLRFIPMNAGLVGSSRSLSQADQEPASDITAQILMIIRFDN